MRGTSSGRRVVGVERLERRSLCSGAAVPLAPGNPAGRAATVATLTPTFTWSPAAGVSGYLLRVVDRTDHGFAVMTTVGPAVTAYTPAAGTLLPARRFVWTVLDVVGAVVGRPHGLFRFGTPALPAPVAASPGSPLDTVRPTLTWSAVPNASGYVIRLFDRTSSTAVTETVPAAQTSYTFAAGVLQPGAAFVFNVRNLIGPTPAAVASNTVRFRLPPLPAPVTIGPGTAGSPGPTLGTLTPTFSWNPVAAVRGFSGYQLDLSDRTTGHTTSIPVDASATSYTLPAGRLVARHRYEWNLRLRDGGLVGLRVSDPSRYFVAPPPQPPPTGTSA